MCRDFVFLRFHLLAFHFNEFRTCRTEPRSGSRKQSKQVRRNKVDRWFGLIGNQDCNRIKGTSFIALEPQFGCNPDCFDYERNVMLLRDIFLIWELFLRNRRFWGVATCLKTNSHSSPWVKVYIFWKLSVCSFQTVKTGIHRHTQ